MRMRTCAAALLVFLLPAMPCAAQPKPLAAPEVKVDFDKSVDFLKYKVYAWVPFQEPAANPANHIRVVRAVEAALAEKGLEKAEPGKPADVFVHVQGRIEKKRPVNSGPSESPWNTTPNQQWKVSVDMKKVDVGTLVLELWDGKTKDIVWRSKGESLIKSPDRMEDLINASVEKLLAEYPPKKEAKQ
jgi:hypothetical protein